MGCGLVVVHATYISGSFWAGKIKSHSPNSSLCKRAELVDSQDCTFDLAPSLSLDNRDKVSPTSARFGYNELGYMLLLSLGSNLCVFLVSR